MGPTDSRGSVERGRRHEVAPAARLAFLLLMCCIFWQAAVARLPGAADLCAIVVGVLLAFPAVRLGRWILDRHPTPAGAAWTTLLMHGAIGITLVVPLIRAIVSHRDWTGWALPVPGAIGLALALLTGAALVVVVVNLALSGLGAPFAVALSRRLATDRLYAWTRNPMVLAALAFLVSLGIRFRSALFVLWVVLLFAPALLFFVRVYEERELEIRFGEPYRRYRASTPFLWPGRRARTPPR